MAAEPEPLHLLNDLRQDMLRFAAEVERATAHMSGPGAPRSRRRVLDVAKRMRHAASACDLMEICKRTAIEPLTPMQHRG